MTHIDTHGGTERFALETEDGVRIPFDTIDASGFGYWEIRADGSEVARVRDLGEWPRETIQAFRAIQFRKTVDLGAQI